MKKALLTLPALALLLAGTAFPARPAPADSLYVPGKSRSMFSDRKARGVGDIVTVLVTETTMAALDADSAGARQTEIAAQGGSGFFFNLFSKLIPKVGLAGKSKTSGNGVTSRNSALAGRITVKVVEVTPAGQLVLQGERVIRTNQDTQTIRFTGIARTEDLQPDNTIQSGFVGDAKIEVTGKGPIDQNIRPGILSRVLRYLF